MALDSAAQTDQRFRKLLETASPAVPCANPELPVRPGSTLTGTKLLEIFEAQMITRQLDQAARRMRAEGQGFYTIASAGHEGNAMVGDQMLRTDLGFLHYRSGGLMAQHSRLDPEADFLRQTLYSLAATTRDQVSGGRHKVWGSKRLWIPPQTSTIASHVPKAVGAALAIDRAHRMGWDISVDPGSLVVCSFGDASLNHSTAQGALNSAAWLGYQAIPTPLLFLCEDNGTGISVPTPPGWIENTIGRRNGIAYFSANGLDLVEGYDVVRQAFEVCRKQRRPVFLHLKVARLLGHAGSDVEQVYRSQQEIQATLRKDPLLMSARHVLDLGLKTPDQVLAWYDGIRTQIDEILEDVADWPRFTSAQEVAATVAPGNLEDVEARAKSFGETEAKASGQAEGEDAKPLNLALAINGALREGLLEIPETMVFGEDVAKKGGVYNVTAGLWKEFGPGRVFNSILDEQAILGLALGAAHLGIVPIPEIQYLAYLHNAEDQIRGEACSLQFFSQDQFRNPMVVRIASYGYQKGFGGHFHNDNSIAVLRDIPGLVLASPARPEDAWEMFRTSLALAKETGRVVAFLEPIALYRTRDLHEEGDQGWMDPAPAPGKFAPLGKARVYFPEAKDLTIVSYANGLYRSLQAAKILQEEHGLLARVVDLRWLNPWDRETVLAEAQATGKLLVVDECRKSGCLGEAILAEVFQAEGPRVRAKLLAGEDTYIPLGPAMELCMPSREDVVESALELCR